MKLNDIAKAINDNARDKGFYDDINRVLDHLSVYPEDREFVRGLWISTRLMLITSELGEALEGLRDGKMGTEPKSGGVGEELSDAAIRVLDLMVSLGLDPEAIIQAKHAYNRTRPPRHGRKTL